MRKLLDALLLRPIGWWLLLIGALLHPLALHAQERYQIETWTTDRGLPQNTVHSIVQTADSYLWLATLDGLVRFDGVRFRIFNKNNTPGLGSNRFTRSLVDKHNDLWVGTEVGSITRYHNGSFQDFPINRDTTRPIWNIALDRDGELLVLGEDGIVRWNGNAFEPFRAIATENQSSILLWGKDGRFWYSVNKTLYGSANGKLKTFELPPSERNSTISSLFEDSRGRVWVATANVGLFVLEHDSLKPFTFPGDPLIADAAIRVEDHDGNLWGVSGRGAVVIAPNGTSTVLTNKEGLSDNSLTSVFADIEGNVWIGTYLKGLNRLNRQSIRFYTTQDGLGANTVYPIFQDRDDSVWLGGMLTQYAGGIFRQITGPERYLKAVTSIEQDRSGRMWFGYWGGVFFRENGAVSEFTDTLGVHGGYLDIHQDRHGAIWFASDKGLFRWAENKVTLFTSNDGLPGNDVKVIMESRDGTLWFGTYGGLAKFANGKFTPFTAADGLASNLVRSLYEDADGVIWIGSYDGGLTRLKEGKFTRFTSREGLFNDGVFQILEDSRRNLWMSCNRGIYRVAKQQLNDFAEGKVARIESIALGKADGLLETECNGGQQPSGIRARDGKLWFPTQGGVAVIDPESIRTNPLPPPVLIESAQIDGQTVKIDQPIQVEPGKNNLEIAYTGLSFIKPEFVKFRYRLDGLQTDWVEAGSRRVAYFSYLPPGTYTFQVIAANADGIWNMTGATVQVIVRPPFYRTWWFWVLTVVIIAAAAYVFYRRRVDRLERSRRAQEDFSRRLLASQEQERQRIAAELHDSIGQSLLVIKNRAVFALGDLTEPEIVKEQLEELSLSATGAIEECREISYNLRPYQIERFGLTKTLKAIFQRMSQVTEIETAIDMESLDGLFTADAETNIYRIVQENVNNIIKHSSATAAGLNTTVRGRAVTITIRDNGSGFDRRSIPTDPAKKGGFGLVGMAERVRMLGGVLHIDTEPGNGTTVKIELITNHERT